MRMIIKLYGKLCGYFFVVHNSLNSLKLVPTIIKKDYF